MVCHCIAISVCIFIIGAVHKEGEERETSSLLVSGTNFSPPNAIVGSGVLLYW